jgi:hypothetical protein
LNSFALTYQFLQRVRCDNVAGAQASSLTARRLSEFISPEIDLLKMDIEGAEDVVMNELASAGKLRQAKRLHVEYHYHVDASADKLSRMLQLIEDNGFSYQLRADDRPWPSEAASSIYCHSR